MVLSEARLGSVLRLHGGPSLEGVEVEVVKVCPRWQYAVGRVVRKSAEWSKGEELRVVGSVLKGAELVKDAK